MQNHGKYQKAATLAEVLAATLILAVGISGLAGLQAFSLQESRAAFLRAEALRLGTDILERISANPAADYGPSALDAPPPAIFVDCREQPCNPRQLAVYDLVHWKCALSSGEAGVPHAVCAELNIQGFGARGSISTDAGTGIRVEWQGEQNSILLRLGN